MNNIKRFIFNTGSFKCPDTLSMAKQHCGKNCDGHKDTAETDPLTLY